MGLYFDNQREAYRVHLTAPLALGGKRISRLLPKTIKADEAQVIHDRMKAELYCAAHLPNREMGWDDYVNSASADKKSWFHAMLQRSRRHAKTYGRQHVLTERQLQFICMRSAGRCEVTGIKFSERQLPGRTVRPFRQSLDRKDATKGYDVDNCRLVLTSVNIAMSAWGEEVIQQVAVGYVVNKFCAPGLMGYLKLVTV